MRPVEIPSPTPADYDGSSYYLSKKASITALESILDAWILRGAKLLNGSPEFGTVAEADEYRTNLRALGSGSRWGYARRVLVEAIGAYCSFCGSSVFSHLAIEHRLPKSTFPSKAFEYRNFLLACSTCNSAKGNNPNQGSVPGHPLSTDEAIKVVTNQAHLFYLWPDYAWPALPARPFPFRVELNWIGFGKSGPYSIAPVDTAFDEFPAWATLLEDFTAGRVGVDRGLYFWSNGPGGNYKKYFSAMMSDAPTLSAAERAAALRLIDLASLNRVIKAGKSAESIDRRMETRTKAYFTAHIIKTQLTQAANLATTVPWLLPRVREQALKTIANTGHWLVWLQVLGNAKFGTETGQEMLRKCFVGTSSIDWTV